MTGHDVDRSQTFIYQGVKYTVRTIAQSSKSFKKKSSELQTNLRKIGQNLPELLKTYPQNPLLTTEYNKTPQKRKEKMANEFLFACG